MSEKTLRTRIVHKHDTEAHWKLAENFIPKQAEIIVYDRDDTYDYERFKIGDGATVVSALPFVSSEVVAATTTTLGGIVSQETTVVDGEKLPVVVEADGKANVHVALYNGAVEGGVSVEAMYAEIVELKTTIADLQTRLAALEN